MPSTSSTSLVCFALHLGLFSASLGAAVDAPHSTESVVVAEVKENQGAVKEVKEVVKEEETEGEDHKRFPRSIPDYQDSLDYAKLSYGDEARSRRRLSDRPAGQDSWSLGAQVTKRGGRGDYYRGGGGAGEQVKLVQESLAEAAAGAASTMLARQQRNGRRYDVPQIGE